MYDILTPSFSEWLYGLLGQLINMFDEEHDDKDKDPPEDRGDELVDDKDKDPDPDPDKDKDKDKDKDPDDDDDDGHMIPKSRYDTASKRATTAEAENTDLKNRLAALEKPADKDPDPTPDERLATLDTQIEKARADNDIDEVVKLMGEQRVIEREVFTPLATETTVSTTSAQKQEADFDAVVANLESKHDMLNADHKDYDEEMVSDILVLQSGFVNSGKFSPAQAMQKAAAHYLPDAPAPTDIDAKKTDLEKNLDAAGKMPPDTKDKGANSDKGGDIVKDAAQINDMSEKEFDALPETTKSRLRGDTYAG